MQKALFFAGLVLAATAVPLVDFVHQGSTRFVFKLKNGGDAPVSVLQWNTPLEGIRNNVFLVVDAETGDAAPYRGIIAKRADPAAEDWVILEAHEAVTADVDLAEFYELEEGRTYAVQYQAQLAIANPNLIQAGLLLTRNTLQFEAAASHPVMIKVTEPVTIPFVPSNEPLPGQLGGIEEFIGCDATQQTELKKAVPLSMDWIKDANAYISKNCTAQYIKYFGTITNVRHTKVKNGYLAMATAFNGKFSFNCAGPMCSASTYAYVYPSDRSHTIYVCGAFWRAPGTKGSFDTKPGTLVHEMSHFSDVVGTKDHIYGNANAQRLAQTDPDKAVNNADNYEYFTEDTLSC